MLYIYILCDYFEAETINVGKYEASVDRLISKLINNDSLCLLESFTLLIFKQELLVSLHSIKRHGTCHRLFTQRVMCCLYLLQTCLLNIYLLAAVYSLCFILRVITSDHLFN